MKIKLISPRMRGTPNVGRSFQLPQMSLALLASLTPPEIKVSITDELIEPVDFDRTSDLIGITVNTKTALRAYEIADAYRERGVPVVLGGIHPKAAQEEALQHADALVIGEAEDLWPRLLIDLSKDRLRQMYFSDTYPSLNGTPHPRRDLFQKDKYETVNLVQTSRGCPYACNFCSVSTMYGAGVRLRPLPEVIEEIETLEGDGIFFVDDNIAGRSAYAKALLQGLARLRKKWIGQASVTIAKDAKMLDLLRNSGCEGLFVGFESTSLECLREMGKTQNLRQDYSALIKMFHDNGIPLLGSFIVGFDSDDASCFEKLLEFVHRTKIDVIDISLLTPYPGTPFYSKLLKEDRLIDRRWWLRTDLNGVVHRPRRMTPEELYEGYVWTLRELYKLVPSFKRCIEGLHRRSLFGSLITWKANMGYRANAMSMTGHREANTSKGYRPELLANLHPKQH